ncbi:MAG: hypothetical protein DRN71_02830 [Candidatus Nanohalarchaeota archaeon]|nr:MAG: hypothetical protein DRN71_02830 [Candidatus Nanohaloarchaeota archaeon]
MKEMKTGILSKIRRAVSKNNALVYPLSVKHDNLEFYRKLKIVRRQIRNADKDSKKALKGNTLALELCQKKIDELGKKCSDIILDLKNTRHHVDEVRRERTSKSQKVNTKTMFAHEREIGILKGTCNILSKDIGRIQHTVEGISRKNIDKNVKENIHNISALEKKVDALSKEYLVMSKDLKAHAT